MTLRIFDKATPVTGWNSSKSLWLIDLIVPFCRKAKVAKELRETILKNQKIKSLQPAPNGNGMSVVEW